MHRKYILRLDSDDYLHPKAIELLHSILKKDKNIGLVFPNFFGLIISQKLYPSLIIIRKKLTPKNIPAHGACSKTAKNFK